MFAVEDCSCLFQTECILFDGKGTMNRSNTVGPAQSRVAG